MVVVICQEVEMEMPKVQNKGKQCWTKQRRKNQKKNTQRTNITQKTYYIHTEE